MTAENLIVGGGLAGATAACSLARAGRDVLLMERDAAPRHKVCGEFLSAETIEMLGLDLAALGAVPVRFVRLTNAGGTARQALPFPAMSLTRLRLDEAMLQRAAACGARVLRGVRVDTFDATPHHATARLNAGAPVSADAVFVATGKHDVRAHPRPAGRQRNLVGLKMYFQLEPEQAAELQEYVELYRYRGGYAGLQPVEGGAANFTCLIERAAFQKAGGSFGTLLRSIEQQLPLLRARLAGAAPLLEKPLAITPIPYGFVRTHTDGGWYLGDQAAVIPSFTGDGMAIAVYSGLLAARRRIEGRSAAEFQRELADAVRVQVGRATWISRAMVSPVLSPALLAATRVFPSLLGVVARATRLREEALAPVFTPDRAHG